MKKSELKSLIKECLQEEGKNENVNIDDTLNDILFQVSLVTDTDKEGSRQNALKWIKSIIHKQDKIKSEKIKTLCWKIEREVQFALERGGPDGAAIKMLYKRLEEIKSLSDSPLI